MRIIYCDLCDVKIGDITKDGVERKRDSLSVKIGKKNFPEVCPTCYSNILMFVEGMTKCQSTT